MIKALKVFIVLCGFITFMCLFFTPFLYGEVIREVTPILWLEFVFSILTLAMMFAYKILKDIEVDNKDWMELGKGKGKSYEI